jgi:transcriptional regulator with XRE-family HTH domain
MKAVIEGEMLSWARSLTNTPLEIAAKAAGVTPEHLLDWESGESQPTIRQLHLLAKKYRLPFAVFYLSDPPDFRIPKVRDFRSLEGLEPVLDDYVLLSEIRNAWEKREVILEYQEEQLSASPQLPFGISVGDDSSTVSAEIRESLGITMDMQSTWRETRNAFNALRDIVENLGILVLQTSALDLSTMRGFSLDLLPLPVVVVNRKDAYAGRSFTLLHELTHICLQTSAPLVITRGADVLALTPYL